MLREICEYILAHKEGIVDSIDKLRIESYTNPILSSYLAEATTDEVVHIVAEGLNLHYADVAEVLDHTLLTKLLGTDTVLGRGRK